MPKMQQTQVEWSARAEYTYYTRHDKMMADDLENAKVLELRRKGYPDERLQFDLFWPGGPEKATRDKVVLDLASGEAFTGCAVSELLSAAHVISMDAVVPQIFRTSQVWKKYAFTDNISFVVGDAYNIPLHSGSVDIVIVSRSIHHLPQFFRVLFEIDRVLAADGTAIIVEPNDHTLLRFVTYFLKAKPERPGEAPKDRTLLRFATLHEGSENESLIKTDLITAFYDNLRYSTSTSYYFVRFPSIRWRYLATNYLLRAEKIGTKMPREPKPVREVRQMLCCPITRLPLEFSAGEARTVDGSHVYPSYDNLPVLLPDGELRELAERTLNEAAPTLART